MTVEAQVSINGSKAAVWAAITNIADATATIRGIEKIEVVERPATGLVGLKWKETRMLFGKEATVEKWITEAKENEFYTTRAEQDGFVFITINRISGSDGSVTLTGIHETRPQGLAARLKSLPMVFFKGVIKKAILQDLNDIKAAVERESITWSKGPPKTNLESWEYINSFIDSLHGDEHWARWKPMARSVVGDLEARGLAPMFRIGQSMYTIIVSTSPHFGLTLEQLRVRLDFYPDEQVVHVAYGPGRPEIEEQVALPNALPRVLHYLQRLWRETKPDVQMPEGLNTT
jgi:hypothetical protein